MMYHHDVMPDTFENMLPWEKDIYVNMYVQKVTEENEKTKIEESARRARGAR